MRGRLLHSPPVDLRRSRRPPLGRIGLWPEPEEESSRTDPPALFPETEGPHPRPYLPTAEVDLRPAPRQEAWKEVVEDPVVAYDVLEDLLDRVLDSDTLTRVALEAWTEARSGRFPSRSSGRRTEEPGFFVRCPVHGPRFL
ncbi:uncharacterized protein LOC111628341 [Centruroides sculpturatus]|uniref:uncharacterized protein LOC111628341 n=1 Tax=Centruroides sculpturatus TaxID=218467 RepID=UPI000C6DB0B6|nr:uncharacterized protein LOC111628341 [Centruroides sculpturatus]